MTNKVFTVNEKNIATYTFCDSVWKYSDKAWRQAREKRWNNEVRFNVSVGTNLDRSELKGLKDYFMRGEWWYGDSYSPGLGDRFLLCPYDIEVMSEILFLSAKSEHALETSRRAIIGMLAAKYTNTTKGFFGGKEEEVLNRLILTKSPQFNNDTVDVNGFKIREFPFTAKAFFFFFVETVEHWFSGPKCNPNNPIQYLIEYWFSSLPYLDPKELQHKKYMEYIYTFMLNMRRFIEPYPTNSGATERKKFVSAFNACAKQYGFHHDRLTELWVKAKKDPEDEWVNNILSQEDIEEAEEWPNYLPGDCRDFYAESEELNEENLALIVDCYCKKGFVNKTFSKEQIDSIRVDTLLTPEFTKKLGVKGKLYGQRYRIDLNSKFIGTENAIIAIDLILLNASNDKASQNILLAIERPKEHYAMMMSRVYVKNREFMVSALKEECSIEFIRLYGFTAEFFPNKSLNPHEQAIYNYLSNEPFFDADYYMLKSESYGLLMELSS